MLFTISLHALGWSPFFQDAFDQAEVAGSIPARVALQHRNSYGLLTESGPTTGSLKGDFGDDLPAVGDWVCATLHGEISVVERILPRRTLFVRKVPGDRAREQVLAANMDHVFIVAALDGDPNVRRVERYLTVAWESGAQPVVVLTKSDLSTNLDDAILAVEGVAPGVAVHAVSNVTGDGVEDLRAYLEQGSTCALLGPSGVGKSTLVNRLTGSDIARVGDVHFSGEGKHTTTHRELIIVPGGGVLLDTPGLRELQLWHAQEGLDETFSDIAELAAGCRFSDCVHKTEPGCAVRAAVEAGTLDAARLASYHKLERELRALELRHDKRAMSEQRRKFRADARARRKGVVL